MEVNLSEATGNLQNNLVTNSQSINTNSIKGPVHFIGIGGIGMSALARILLAKGVEVSGSDRANSELLEELESKGAKIFIGHQASNIKGSGAVVVSTAITEDNPEMVEALAAKIPVIHRSQMLALLTQGHKLLGVSGTHGKTTTTGMLAQILVDGGLDPTVVVGGVFTKIGSNSRYGKGDYFVAEIDESDGTHISVNPSIGVITNIETDHLENYPGGLEEILQSMVTFCIQTKDLLVVCLDDPGCQRLLEILPKDNIPKILTYSTKKETINSDYSFESTSSFGFRVYQGDVLLGETKLSVPGTHNKSNALACCVIGLYLGIPFDTISSSLNEFCGVNRRFQILGTENGITVIDDYAHHPTEVVATLQAAREYLSESDLAKRLVILFQPHQPGRLKNHWTEFLNAFANADLVFISEIYIARGKPIQGVSSEIFVKEMSHADAHYLPGKTEELARSVLPHLKKNDILMTVGAGDITKVGPQILELLRSNGRSA